MCWISKKLDKQIANKDIVVYKLLGKNIKKICFIKRAKYYAPFKGPFEYKKGKKYCLDSLFYLKNPDSKTYYIFEGFYSFANINDMLKEYPRLIDYDDFTIAKCIIPKGAEYCINESNEIVSNQIIFKKEIKQWNTK